MVLWKVDKSKEHSLKNSQAIVAKIVCLLFLEVEFTDMKPHFNQENRSH